MIKVGELIDLIETTQETEIIITGCGSVHAEAETLVQVLKDEITEMAVTGVEIHGEHLRMWAESR